ncbi:hypothetical protein BCV70DRAFT_197634 [Testicularia cyperi]|uniref:Acyl-CoA thioesterase-like N-terminal HotDog domain-containing protein n=1 Tax=Testicularia cyperi TaxID=1882483 RepID=A0A317XZ68_9BASI|nr:hypothetical protein BCV70DRAFT_197634 [Testicularia cyperi]
MPGLQTASLSRLDESSVTSTFASYVGSIDTTWCIGSVPQGGYSLSIILNAVLAFMHTPEFRSTNIKGVDHFDPLLLSAMYVQAVSWDEFSVEVKIIKRGKSITNLQADLIQKGQLRITTQVLMTNFVTQKESADKTSTLKGPRDPERNNPIRNGYTLTPRSQWAPQLPISPPNECKKPRYFGKTAESGKTFNFGQLIMHADDPKLEAKTRNGKRLEAGSWYTLVPEPKPDVRPELAATGRVSRGDNLIPFFADMFTSPPMIVPGKHLAHWYPTLHLTIEFKRPLPPQAPITRTGTYSNGRFMINGQHESYTELWSHPDDTHLFDPSSAQKRIKRSYILAIARQTALVLPFAVNQNKTKAKSKL